MHPSPQIAMLLANQHAMDRRREAARRQLARDLRRNAAPNPERPASSGRESQLALRVVRAFRPAN
jgi:hypothetical protein